MTNKLPFDFFRNFIQSKAKDSLVYLNLYCLIELYRKKIQSLLIHSNALKKQTRDGQDFDVKNIPELRP